MTLRTAVGAKFGLEVSARAGTSERPDGRDESGSVLRGRSLRGGVSGDVGAGVPTPHPPGTGG